MVQLAVEISAVINSRFLAGEHCLTVEAGLGEMKVINVADEQMGVRTL